MVALLPFVNAQTVQEITLERYFVFLKVSGDNSRRLFLGQRENSGPKVKLSKYDRTWTEANSWVRHRRYQTRVN